MVKLTSDWNFDLNKKVDIDIAKKLFNMHMHTFWNGHASLKVDDILCFLKNNGFSGVLNEHLACPLEFLKDDALYSSKIFGGSLVNFYNNSYVRFEFLERFIFDVKQSGLKVGFEVDSLKGYYKETNEMISYVNKLLKKSKLKLNHISLSLHQIRGHSIFSDVSAKVFFEDYGFKGVVDAYFEDFIEGILEIKPDFICHPGIIELFFNRINYDLNKSEKEYIDNRYKELIDLCIKQKVLIELNTSGFVKLKSCSPYMSYDVFCYAVKRGANFVCGSDFHHLDQGFSYFDQLYMFLKNHKVKTIFKIIDRKVIPINI